MSPSSTTQGPAQGHLTAADRRGPDCKEGECESRYSAAILMGVSGCGKSTVGRLVAQGSGWQFKDGDDLHTEASVAKMRAGQPLTDADRYPWLRDIRREMDRSVEEGRRLLVACSALKRAYREFLLQDYELRHELVFIYLRLGKECARQRVEGRKGHFMGARMVDSQFEILDEPDSAKEPVLVVNAELSPQEVADQILAHIRDDGSIESD